MAKEVLGIVEAVVVVGVGVDISPLPHAMLVEEHVNHLDRGRALGRVYRCLRCWNRLLGVLAKVGVLVEGEGLRLWKLWLVRAREGLVLLWSVR